MKITLESTPLAILFTVCLGLTTAGTLAHDKAEHQPQPQLNDKLLPEDDRVERQGCSTLHPVGVSDSRFVQQAGNAHAGGLELGQFDLKLFGLHKLEPHRVR